MNTIFKKYTEITKVIKLGEEDNRIKLLVFTDPDVVYQRLWNDLLDEFIKTNILVDVFMAADPDYEDMLTLEGETVYERGII